MIKEVAEVFNSITDEEWAKFINDYFKKVILDNENVDYTKEINTEFKVARRDNSEYNTYGFKIKDEIVNFLTPIISSCNIKKDFENKLKQNLKNIECISNNILAQNNFDYKSSAKIDNEYFPVRSYDNLTLENGYYDALIIKLGSGEGDNWWCVVYPPLCFLNSNADYKYKSRIAELIKKYFGG